MTDETQKSLIAALQTAHFRYRTLNEAKVLAAFLAEACPNFFLSNVGLCELFINAVEHGNLQIKHEEKAKLQADVDWLKEIERRLELPENKHKYVHVYFLRTKAAIEIRVVDQGTGFNW